MMWVHWKLGLKVLWMAQNQLGFLRKGVAERIWLYWDHYFYSIPMWHRWFCTKKACYNFHLSNLFQRKCMVLAAWKKSNGSIQRLKNICTASGHDWLKGTEFEKIKTENSDWDAFFKIIEKLFVENTTICLKFLSITLQLG